MSDPTVTARLQELTSLVQDLRQHLESTHNCQLCTGSIHRVEDTMQRLADAINAEVPAAGIIAEVDVRRGKRYFSH